MIPDQYILDYFVDRADQIGLMWQMEHLEVETRVLAVEGIFGIGKSYLVKEFKAQCQENRIDVVYLDFEDHYGDPGYKYVVQRIWTELGPEGFEPLARAFAETKERGAHARLLEELRTRSPGQFSAIPSVAGADVQDANSAEGSQPPARAGGVNIYGGDNTFRDVAGRDINNFFQVFQHEDPFVQDQIQIWITGILKSCLEEVTRKRSVVFLFDHWQKLDDDSRQWVARSLVKWLADDCLPKACMVITGLQVPDLDPRRRVKKIKLSELDDQTAYLYLEKRGLSREDAPQIVRVARGIPLILAMAAGPIGQ